MKSYFCKKVERKRWKRERHEVSSFMEVIRVVFLSILPLFTQAGPHSQSETGHLRFCYGFTAPENEETNKKTQGGEVVGRRGPKGNVSLAVIARL